DEKRAHRGSHHDLTNNRNLCVFTSDGVFGNDTGIVVWLECEAAAYVFEDLMCGFQLKEQTSWRIQKTRRFDKSIYPEVWFFQDWPAFPIREGLSGISNWTHDGTAKHPFEAKIRWVRSS